MSESTAAQAQGLAHPHHDGPCHHNHNHNPDFGGVEANKEYFDKHAEKFEEIPYARALTTAISDKMKAIHTFDPESSIIMDFACGTGLISRNLVPHVKEIVGVDVSEGLLLQFKRSAEKEGIPKEKIRTACIELKGEEGELEGQKFDAIVCSASYHHFASIADMTRILAGLLKPGGVLIVADFIKGGMPKAHNHNQNHSHDHNHNHNHPEVPEGWERNVSRMDGFEEQEIRSVFEDAGLRDFVFNPDVIVGEGDYRMCVFVAKGVHF